MPLSEQNFQTALTTALNVLITQRNAANYGGCNTPSTNLQALHKLQNGSGYDILKRISESELLILEVKIKEGYKLRSFDAIQYAFYDALYNYGVPIRYCYNLVNDYVATNNSKYTLNQSKISYPFQLLTSDKKVDEERHDRLLPVLEGMLSNGGTGGAISAFLAAVAIADATKLTTRMLLIAYNQALHECYIFKQSEFAQIARKLASDFIPSDLRKELLSDSSYVRSALESISCAISDEIDQNNEPPDDQLYDFSPG